MRVVGNTIRKNTHWKSALFSLNDRTNHLWLVHYFLFFLAWQLPGGSDDVQSFIHSTFFFPNVVSKFLSMLCPCSGRLAASSPRSARPSTLAPWLSCSPSTPRHCPSSWLAIGSPRPWDLVPHLPKISHFFDIALFVWHWHDSSAWHCHLVCLTLVSRLHSTLAPCLQLTLMPCLVDIWLPYLLDIIASPFAQHCYLKFNCLIVHHFLCTTLSTWHFFNIWFPIV